MNRSENWPCWSHRAIEGVRDGLVLFDGVCVFCSRWVQFVIARDPGAQFRFLPIQTPAGRDLALRLSIDPDHAETNAVILDGAAYYKSDGALRTLGRLPGLRWTRVFLALPRPIRDFVYDRVAKNRYRLFGRSDSCFVPTPELMRRFVPEDGPVS